MKSSGDPANKFDVVTKHDVNNFSNGECNYLYVGTAGDVTAICSGVAVLFKSLAAGWHPIRCTRVNNTGTTAADILAAYVTN